MSDKKLFTACTCILFERNPGIDAVKEGLVQAGYSIASQSTSMDDPIFMSDFLGIRYRSDVFSMAYIDILHQRWPDMLGFPEEPGNHKPEDLNNWAVGCYGPGSYPNCLRRASESNYLWPEAMAVAEKHSCVVRIRISYTLGAEAGLPFVPETYDPMHELTFVASLALTVSQVPGAIGYFNPKGEVLCPLEAILQHLQLAVSGELPPIGLFTSIRVLTIGDEWMLMDTVGNSQYGDPNSKLPLPMQDFEVCIPKASFDFRATSLMLIQGTTMLIRNGPAQGYQGSGATVLRQCSLATPPRPSVRMFQGTPPEELLMENKTPVYFI